MKITWKTFLAVSAYWAGVFGWFYIGVWQVLKKPVHSVILAQIAGHLSIGGQQLIELGCPKGKAMGELLGQLLSLCIEGKLENTPCALQLEACRRIKDQFPEG